MEIKFSSLQGTGCTHTDKFCSTREIDLRQDRQILVLCDNVYSRNKVYSTMELDSVHCKAEAVHTQISSVQQEIDLCKDRQIHLPCDNVYSRNRVHSAGKKIYTRGDADTSPGDRCKFTGIESNHQEWKNKNIHKELWHIHREIRSIQQEELGLWPKEIDVKALGGQQTRLFTICKRYRQFTNVMNKCPRVSGDLWRTNSP